MTMIRLDCGWVGLLLLSLMQCCDAATYRPDEPGVIWKELVVSSDNSGYPYYDYPKEYSIRVSAVDDDIILKYARKRELFPEEIEAISRDPVNRDLRLSRKAWSFVNIPFKGSSLPRVEAAFSKFHEWAEKVQKENIKSIEDYTKIIDDIAEEPHKSNGRRLLFVFVFSKDSSKAVLRIQYSEEARSGKSLTAVDVSHFQSLLQQVPTMKDEAKNEWAQKLDKDAEKRAKAVEDKKRLDELLK